MKLPMKRCFQVLCFGLLLVLFCSATGMAQTTGSDISPSSLQCGLCEAAESQNWAKSAPGKIGRGLVNAGLGWTNLFSQPIQAASSGDNVLGGLGRGIADLFVRTLQGVVELGLFWLPPAAEEAVHQCALGDLKMTQR